MPFKVKRSLCAVLLCVSGFSALSAGVDAEEFKALRTEAAQNGAVAILIDLPGSVGLSELGRMSEERKADLRRAAQVILSELGNEVWTGGSWNNGLGQLGVYVTPQGLQFLANSGNAKSFMRDPTASMRSRATDVDGNLSRIETLLRTRDWIDVEVTLNGDLTFDYMVNGTVRTKANDQSRIAILHQRLMEKLPAKALQNMNRHDWSLGKAIYRVTREGYLGLRNSPEVRSLRIAGETHLPGGSFDEAALTRAKVDGSAEVIIQLRLPDPYNPAERAMPNSAWQAQSQGLRAALSAVIEEASGGVLHSTFFNDTGTAIVRLTPDKLARMYKVRDPRIHSIELNKPAAQAGLASSTVLTNMPSAWAAGFRGAGQNIVILDTGVRKDHDFFKVNGVSKVAYEFCAGTNQSPYKSICPNADAGGDSPLNYPGSGSPPPATVCSQPVCNHGTHVAGIAAGVGAPTLPAGLQGVAPGAQLVAAQVFSYASGYEPTAFRGDILAGLNKLLDMTSSDNFIANLSIYTKSTYASDCKGRDLALEATVEKLNSRNIPVVIITGNGISRNGISWPGCTPLTIKVGATVNWSGNPDLIDSASNIGNPSAYTGAFLMAPGYSIVSASKESTTATINSGGTSMAAPHVAGFYAAIKAAAPGISNADATGWIYANGSVPILANGYQYRRIKAPNF